MMAAANALARQTGCNRVPFVTVDDAKEAIAELSATRGLSGGVYQWHGSCKAYHVQFAEGVAGR